MKKRDMLILEINSKYNINVLSIENFLRNDPGHENLLLKLNCENGVFFYKEIPVHSLENNLNQIYAQIATISPKSYKLVLPLMSNEQCFCEEISSKKMMIYPFVSHTVLMANDIPIERLLYCLSEFHENIQELDIPTHPFKTYKNWFESR